MPISSGFSPDRNPDYYVRRPGKREILDETIFYKREEPPFERPAEIVNRPIIRETIFMPDRRPPPLVSNRDLYTIAPEPAPLVYAPTPTAEPYGSFHLLPALGLNADCPCWAWICIIFSFIVLLGLVAMCLYFLLKRDGYV